MNLKGTYVLLIFCISAILPLKSQSDDLHEALRTVFEIESIFNAFAIDDPILAEGCKRNVLVLVPRIERSTGRPIPIDTCLFEISKTEAFFHNPEVVAVIDSYKLRGGRRVLKFSVQWDVESTEISYKVILRESEDDLSMVRCVRKVDRFETVKKRISRSKEVIK